MIKIYLCIVALFIVCCKDKQPAFKSPAGYDLASPAKFVMPEALNEISGIAFYKGNNDTLYAEQDEEGKLFYLHPGDKKARASRFGKKGDYEDLAIINDRVIVLRSDGALFAFPFTEKTQEEISRTTEWKDLVPNGEYEGLFADETDNKLYVLCKQCKKEITVFILQHGPGDTIVQSGEVSIDIKAIEKLSGEKKLNFHPSALAKNPLTQEWYLLSSVNKMLVIADNSWNVKEVYPLDPALFRQPEGIAFDRENNLYIANEGDAVSNGNVLKFVFNRTN